jgi:hypothetical protein
VMVAALVFAALRRPAQYNTANMDVFRSKVPIERALYYARMLPKEWLEDEPEEKAWLRARGLKD